MMFRTVLGNPDHPEYGVATIPFPIPREQFSRCTEMLAMLEAGDAVKQDCKVLEVTGAFPVLKCMEQRTVNLDELDYLAKRLESFDIGEAAQFQAMAHKLELTELKDLINLTFCCQQATVITDFTDLEAVGRDHYMNLHGGCVLTDELNNVDGYETALLLIRDGAGTITPYGVAYDNGMKLEQAYDGRHFPGYHYEQEVLMVALTSRNEPEDTQATTWLYFPAEKEQLERAMLRSGIEDPDDMQLRFIESQFPVEVDNALDFRREGIFELNELATVFAGLTPEDQTKLGAVVKLAEPEYAYQIRHLAENLDLFDYAPGAHTLEELGKYMIRESGRFDYDSNLDEFYNFEKYGLQRMEQQAGQFTDRGYIAYLGAMSLDELMMEDPAEQMDFKMEGMA